MVKHGDCKRCSHFAQCTAPCEPVRRYLAEGSSAVIERKATDEAGRAITIVLPKHRHVPFSVAFGTRENKTGAGHMELSTESRPAWAQTDFKNRQTSIFVDRFFGGFSFDDLAEKYDLTKSNAQSHYYNAIERLKRSVFYLDREENTAAIQRAIDEAEKTIPNSVKWLVMHKVMGISQKRIVELTGAKSSNVAMQIRDAADRMAAGELDVLPFTDDERRRAAERIRRTRERQAGYRARRRAEKSH